MLRFADIAGAETEAGELSAARERLALRTAGLLLFPILTGLGAMVSVPLPPFGVPFTLQTLIVVMAALMLGPRLGAASMALYVVMGMIGVPLFADGEVGLQVILGQTGGYLLGFVVCQPVVTAIVRRRDKTIRGWGAMVLATVAAHAVIFGLGVPWLYVIRSTDDPITWQQAVMGGLVPFLPGMVVKCAVAVFLGKLAAPWASRRIW